jgi:hypothetical protein
MLPTKSQLASRRKPFSVKERRLIAQAIAESRVQRIGRGGWSDGAFGALLGMRALIDLHMSWWMGPRKRGRR